MWVLGTDPGPLQDLPVLLITYLSSQPCNLFKPCYHFVYVHVIGGVGHKCVCHAQSQKTTFQHPFSFHSVFWGGNSGHRVCIASTSTFTEESSHQPSSGNFIEDLRKRDTYTELLNY